MFDWTKAISKLVRRPPTRELENSQSTFSKLMNTPVAEPHTNIARYSAVIEFKEGVGRPEIELILRMLHDQVHGGEIEQINIIPHRKRI